MAGWRRRRYGLSTTERIFIMATYKIRGTSHNVVYPYVTASGKRKQQWESYTTELEAIQRKAYIDFLQNHKNTDGRPP